MTETQVLLGKIAALRQRLEQAQGLARDASTAAAALAGESLGRAVTLQQLERQTAQATEHDVQLDHAVRPLVVAAGGEDGRPMPKQLTIRARRILERGRELLAQLRALDDAFVPGNEAAPASPGLVPRSEPLARHYRETIAIVDTALRMVPLFPDSAAAQLHLCEGVEAILSIASGRLRALSAGVARYRAEAETVTRLTALLTTVAAEQHVPLDAFRPLVEAVLADAEEGGPLHFLDAPPEDQARFIACHSLTTARVIARVVRHDPELRARAADAVLAALLHDVGMLRVHVEILTHDDAIDVEQRRMLESHCRIGAELVTQYRDEAPWLMEAALSHHERLDGTGYPDGLKENQVSSLARLLAVCDVYASFCTNRPHRPARPTRTALADTLLLAEQGLLDRQHAEGLLHLTFYPIGTAVELADGTVGVVVATPGERRDLNAPARPVVAVLLDAQGQPQAAPRHLDLARSGHHSIVRSLSRGDRIKALGEWFPEWV
jgi:HD-GYP domain-containing protein (c-di-GMP phosphodiesterase class II)